MYRRAGVICWYCTSLNTNSTYNKDQTTKTDKADTKEVRDQSRQTRTCTVEENMENREANLFHVEKRRQETDAHPRLMRDGKRI
jgi:hypothetical protein